MFTRHGHHIPGTIKDQTRPKFTKRCGGVNHCQQCTGEWEKWYTMKSQEINVVGVVPVTIEVNGKSQIVGEAKMEKLKSGGIVAHVELAEGYSHLMTKGFSLGSFSVADE